MHDGWGPGEDTSSSASDLRASIILLVAAALIVASFLSGIYLLMKG